MLRLRILLLVAASLPAWTAVGPAQSVESDGPGNIRSITAGGRRVPITSEIVMPAKGWGTSANSRWNSTLLEYISYQNGSESWRGRAAADSGGPSFEYLQTRQPEGSRIRFQIRVTSLTSQAIEGVFLFLNFPIALFGGGEAVFTNGLNQTARAQLPTEFGDTYLVNASADGCTLDDVARRFHFNLRLPRGFWLTLQDNRRWGDAVYALFFPLHSGNLAANQSVTLEFTLELTGTPDTSPLTLDLGPNGSGEIFEGWGGNFVFNTTAPETDWLLSQLRVTWARAGMDLAQWEPANDNASSSSINWNYFEQRLLSGAVAQQFEIARKLKARQLPLILSVWYLPRWMQPGGNGAKVPAEHWNELLESIGAWLLMARDRFGFEADYFSFNEPDLGVYVLQSPEEHRDAVKSIGQYLASLGLKTKLLIGDTANPSNPSYVDALAADTQALQVAGPVAFHTWNGSTPENYRRWRQTARTLRRPLLATEVGSDPAAWHYPSIFWSYGYALDDLANYFGFLQHARPQSALQWELTSDYPLARRNQDGTFSGGKRFWFVKHLANLTPPDAEYLDVLSPVPDDVGVLAFRGPGGTPAGGAAAGPRQWVIHLANFGPARTATVTGIPPESPSFQPYRTSAGEEMAVLTPIPVTRGVLELELAEQSLTTLVGEESVSSLHFAHFAQGAGLLSSRVILVNPDPVRTVSATIQFRGDTGDPLALPLADGAATASPAVQVPPLGVQVVETASGGPVRAGSATISADGPLAGTVLFGGQVGLAGVPAGNALTGPFQVPVEVNRGLGVNTGLALAGRLGRANPVTLELLSPGGLVLAEAEIRLDPLGHSARFVDEIDWSPAVELSSFHGSVRAQAPDPVTATVLQTRPGEFLTLPVAQAAEADQAPAGSTLYFTQFGEGGGLLSSQVILMNPGSTLSSATLFLRTPDGTPLTVDLNGEPAPGQFNLTVPAAGVTILSTDGEGPVRSGSAEVQSSRPLSGVLLFTGAAGSAGVGTSPALTGGFLLPVERNLGAGTNTGVAIHNLADRQVRVKLRLRDRDGQPVADASFQLAARGHDARFVNEVDWASPVDLGDFLGVLDVELEAPATAIGLLSRPGQLATLPVATPAAAASPQDRRPR